MTLAVPAGLAAVYLRNASQYSAFIGGPARHLYRTRGPDQAAAFSGGQLTNYKGTKHGISGYFTTPPLIMTGPGSVTEANAGTLSSTADGYSSYLVP